MIAGRNLHIARTLAGYTQQRLGDEVGLTFQQIQKYENANNRMALSRAWQFAKILGIGFSTFVDGVEDLPTDSTMHGPQFNEWLTLYVGARRLSQIREITAIAGRIVEFCELTKQERSQCS